MVKERADSKTLERSIFLLPSPLPFFASLSDFPLLITAVGYGVGVPMGYRSTPLPFLSPTPFPPLPPTRLSGALTLPGNKLPVSSSEVSQYYCIPKVASVSESLSAASSGPALASTSRRRALVRSVSRCVILVGPCECGSSRVTRTEDPVISISRASLVRCGAQPPGGARQAQQFP